MHLHRRRLLQLAGAVVALPALPAPRRAAAQAYPARPVHLIVGQAPGSSSDIVSRLIGQRLSEKLGQQFLVENRAGAGTNIATEAVVNAPPDGYTMLLVNAQNSINAALYGRTDFVRTIAPVAGVFRVPLVMEVHPDFPAKTVPEFIAYAKANPGKVNMASAGNGGPQHLAGELFKVLAGVDLVHVPYRGSTPALTDLLAGQVQVMFDVTPSSISHVAVGPAARARDHHCGALGRAARSADGGRVSARLRGQRLDRLRRAEEHAGGRHRGAQSRGQRCGRRSGDQDAARRSRRPRPAARPAGRFRQADHRRHRQVG